MKFFLKIAAFLLPFFGHCKPIDIVFQRPENSTDSTQTRRSDFIDITTLKFYIAEIRLFFSEKEIASDTLHHLIDLSETTSCTLTLNSETTTSPDSICIVFGTDSITNCSGAMGGDLDPSMGMYWTWQSGYINYKLEGHFDDKPFEYHLGGYRSPNQTHCSIGFRLVNTPLKFLFDISGFLEKSAEHPGRKVMSPGPLAARFSELFVSCFVLQTP